MKKECGDEGVTSCWALVLFSWGNRRQLRQLSLGALVKPPVFINTMKQNRMPSSFARKLLRYRVAISCLATSRRKLRAQSGLVDRNSQSTGVYLGVRICEVSLCFVAIVRVRVQLSYLLCFLCFTSQVSVTGSYAEDEPSAVSCFPNCVTK